MRRFDREALWTWPVLIVTVNLLPWQWRLVPFGALDHSPRRRGSVGWWGIDAAWLFVSLSFGFNLPPFETPWTTLARETGRNDG